MRERTPRPYLPSRKVCYCECASYIACHPAVTTMETVTNLRIIGKTAQGASDHMVMVKSSNYLPTAVAGCRTGSALKLAMSACIRGIFVVHTMSVRRTLQHVPCNMPRSARNCFTRYEHQGMGICPFWTVGKSPSNVHRRSLHHDTNPGACTQLPVRRAAPCTDTAPVDQGGKGAQYGYLALQVRVPVPSCV